MFQTDTAASQQALENPATITTADFIKPKKCQGLSATIISLKTV